MKMDLYYILQIVLFLIVNIGFIALADKLMEKAE